MKMRDYYEPYLKWIKADGRCEKTINEHRGLLYGPIDSVVGKKKLKHIRMSDVALIKEAGAHIGTHGMQRSVLVFRRLLKFLYYEGYSVPIHIQDITLPQVPQKPVEFLTKEELAILRARFGHGDIANVRTRALIELLLGSGLRISEALALNKEDVDWERSRARITNSKTKAIEDVLLNVQSIYWLRYYISRRQDDLPYLFVSGRGRMLSTTSRNYLRIHTRGIGIKKDVHHHLFRKTFTTLLLQEKVEIQTVRKLARHKSERTTLRYYAATDTERTRQEYQRVMNSI